MKNFYSLRPFTFSFIFLFFSINMFSQYTDGGDLADDVNAATGGGTFIVTDGEYDDFEASFEIMATASNPIIIKAATVGGVILTGESHFVFKKSAYITLEGFVIDGTGDDTLVKLEGCNNIRITRNVFELETTESIKWVYIGGIWDDDTIPYQFLSHNNRIDHNTFQNKTTPGHYITVDGTNGTVQSQYDRIDHNYFKNNSPRATNEQESIRIGWSEMSQSSGYTTVEFNLFEDCDGDPEIVSVKSCDNIIRHNTFLSSYGTLSLRHGNRNRVEGNYFFGNGKAIGTSDAGSTLYTGGIRIYGTDHVIINNYMEGLTGTKWDAPITLTLGDAIDGESSSLSKHFRAERVTIAYNTLVNNAHGIEIGYNNNGSYSKDLADITIANNLITGSENALVEIIDGEDQGSNVTWLNNLMNPTGDAETLSGESTTSFNGTTDAIDDDPELVLNTDITYDNTAGVWKTTADTPLYENKVTLETVGEDIEGQDRPETSNPGADHFSMESVRYNPITVADVGPASPEGELGDIEVLSVPTEVNFVSAGESQEVDVISNLEWTVTESESWISATPMSGSNSMPFSITADENTTLIERTGTIIVEGGELSRKITVTQEGAPRTNLINTGEADDPVTINFVSKENTSKSEVAINTLDKDMSSVWAAEDDDVPSGEYKADGEYIIYDLGGSYTLDFIQFNTTSKSDAFGFQILVSTTGTEESDFSMILPTTGDLLFTATNTTEFNQYEVATEVRYVKIIGYGRFNSDGDSRKSGWSAIGEIEFFGDAEPLSTDEFEFNNNILVYPVPAKDNLNIKILNDRGIDSAKLFSVDGKLLMEKEIDNSQLEFSINIESLSNGTYILNLSGDSGLNVSKMIIVSE